MRRVSILAAISLMAMLVMAPAAFAQQEGLESFCPDGGVPAAPQGAQQGGGGDLLCFPMQEQAQTYNETGEIPQSSGEIYNPSTGRVINPEVVPCDEVLRPEGAAGGPAPIAVVNEFGEQRTQECLDQLEAQQQPDTGGDQYEQLEGTVPEQPPTTGGDMTGGTGDDGMTNLPDTGGLGLGGVAAGLGAMLVAGGLLVRRRLS